jgi:membrane AbrB-like protein
MGTPLPWMLGALFSTMIAAMCGAPLYVPQLFRRLWIIVLGVMLGSSFGPETLDHVVLWGGSFLGMILFVAGTTALVAWFYRKVGGFDRNTALFCATPGGLGEMAILGPALGADERTIVLTHATRIVMVMAFVPPAYALIEGYVPPPDLGAGGRLLDAGLADLILLAVVGFGGAFIAKLIRLPAWQMCGSMFASAAIHAGGITDAKPPLEFVAFAQVVIGSGAGARFAGARLHELIKPMALGAIATLVVLLMAAAVAYGVASALDLDFRAVHLSYSPGGFAEMSLIALALGIEAPFVAVHHMGRIFVVVIMATVLGRVLVRRQAGG